MPVQLVVHTGTLSADAMQVQSLHALVQKWETDNIG